MRRSHLPPRGRRRAEGPALVAAPEGAQRAPPQTRGSAVDAPQGHRAPRRGRARRGAFPQRPLRCGARETARARRTGRACRGQRAVARGLVRDGGGIRSRAPSGAAHEGRRAERLAGQVSSGHAAAAACDGKGTRVKGLMPQLVAGSERPAWQGADRPSQLNCFNRIPRPPGAAGGVRRLRVPAQVHRRSNNLPGRGPAADRGVRGWRFGRRARAAGFPAVRGTTRRGRPFSGNPDENHTQKHKPARFPSTRTRRLIYHRGLSALTHDHARLTQGFP